MKFEINHRWMDNVQFECELPAEVAEKSYGEQLGYAIRQAYKSGADLSFAYLRSADLSGKDLAGADLTGADLTRANLSGANLAGADLSGAGLTRANLSGANLAGADLSGADLARANLSGANLAGAILSGADLSGADLSCADLDGTNLAGANLSGTNLAGANSADLAIARTRILPDGDLIGWKKCRDGVIVKLRIPADARRSHAFGRKCRAEFVDVLEVIGAEVGISEYDGKTEYRVGKRVVSDRFEDDWRQECAPGIHFFITRAEAEAY